MQSSDFVPQRFDIRRAFTRCIVPEGEPELHAGRILRRPTDVAGREFAADETVQGVGFAEF